MRHPARLLPLAFLGVIVLGSTLLMLPVASEDGGSAPPLTALFTATSAVCVTGLIVVDTPSYWSGFGEAVIAVLIQVGGFGIMTFASMLGLLIVGRINLRGRLAAAAETKTLGLGSVRRVVARVGLLTIAVELVIAVILAARFKFEYGYSLRESIWHGVFHAVSAFNNAGFALYPDSLESFVTDPVVTIPIALGVIIGGIGFPVLFDLARRAHRPATWSMHTKITVLGTSILLVAGFISYLAWEWANEATLGHLNVGDKFLAAFFSGVMPRTAGFNSIPVSELQTQTLAATDILMFIGGGSAGTAGGIKVTTFFLLAFVIWAEVRGEPDVNVFNRRITSAVQRQTLTVALLGVAAVVTGAMTMLAVTHIPVDQIVFEAISAFATVGLSTGITAELPASAQLCVIVLMFVGRVGTITVAAALALRTRGRLYHLPHERPIVG